MASEITIVPINHLEEIERTTYGEEALIALGDHVSILHFRSENGYQGDARIVGRDTKTNEIVELSWEWGSCEVCDSWIELETLAIVQELKERIVRYASLEAFRQEHKDEQQEFSESAYMKQNSLVRAVREAATKRAEQENQEVKLDIPPLVGRPSSPSPLDLMSLQSLDLSAFSGDIIPLTLGTYT